MRIPEDELADRVDLIQVPPPPPEERPDEIELPEVDPRVSAEDALRALEGYPGGREVIEQLRQAGRKI